MNIDFAMTLKNAISERFLTTSKTKAPVIGFAMAGASPRAAAITRNIQAHVNGVGIGEKQDGGHFVKVLTRTKSNLSAKDFADNFGVTKQDILLQETGPIRFKMPTNNHRPPYPGISVGHYRITAGTLGCFVKDDSNKVYVLSNNHVLANTNRGYYKDPILQPGKLDGGNKKDMIGGLSYYVPVEYTKSNFMDAAIAEIISGMATNYLVNNKLKVSGTTAPQNKMKVEKYGRTTGHTRGKITTRNLDMKVDFDGKEIDFQDQFEVKANGGKMFCDGGDSGSLIFESGSLKAVGLLFAGADDGTTFATPISDVLNAFAVKIL